MKEHKKMGFLSRFLFSLDHKDIGFQYFLTAMFMAAFGGFFVYVFRYNLAFGPDDIPLYGSLTAKSYNQLVTNHGAIMIFWVGMPMLLSVLGNYLIPIMIGTDDMAFPLLNKISYWTFLLSCIVLLSGFLMPTGAFGGGWTMYPPLSVSDLVIIIPILLLRQISLPEIHFSCWLLPWNLFQC
jgi:cytochrome c oxidase subunit 1